MVHGSGQWIPGTRKVRKQTVVKYPARPPCAFYRFWRRLFGKEVRDDDHGVAGRGRMSRTSAPGLFVKHIFYLIEKKR